MLSLLRGTSPTPSKQKAASASTSTIANIPHHAAAKQQTSAAKAPDACTTTVAGVYCRPTTAST